MALRTVVYSVLVFLALPLVLITVLSFNSTSSFTFPPDGFSLHWYANVFTVRSFGRGLVFSAYLAGASATVGLIVATTASIAITRYHFWGRNFINAVVMAPLVVPEVVMGLAILIWIQAVVWLRGEPAIYLLHSIVVLPYMIRIIVANLQRSDPDLEEAAMLLGAPPHKAFLRITLPLMGKGVAAALIFALVMSFHNFTATFFLIGGRPTLPVAIFQYIRTETDPTIAALSTMLMLSAGLIVWATDRLLGLERISRV